MACEVLTADVRPIQDLLCTPERMATLFGVLDRPAPLHPLLARCVIVVVVEKQLFPDISTQFLYEDCPGTVGEEECGG